ncbi:leucine efflux protein LeuE [Streptacidiphilus sp. P02-A3a]|uniref:leucine efflux protein LeuE n=1 Tax=Streptacidiphilus sp. P02-A3a TaxID=2704468 RepID=UPI0015F93E4E|nr:leucine efflux protein LeuE [Streptacidiphilus sp. P02-A3a]QMU73544.1 leucine efflux protein LeuE [Streptacidiphilus sp. P02-A3a]
MRWKGWHVGVINYGTYAVGALLIVLLPGPNSMYVLSIAARKGVRTGFRAAAGVLAGDTTLILLTSLGAASLLRTTPLVFDAVKLLGAGYLCFLGYGMLKSARSLWQSTRTPAPATPDPAPATPDPTPAPAPAAQPTDRERPFRRALVVSLLNPKAILFLLSFFVQFVSPTYHDSALPFAVLGTTLQSFSVIYLTTLILAGTYLSNAFRRRRRLSAALTTGIAGLFIAFAAKLATASVS